MRDLHEANRRSWNRVTPAHNAHKRDQAGFLRAGGSTLFPEELELVGSVRGQRLVHLQCNAGQDSLSWASLGADVLGVDISDEAVAFAQRLSEDSGIPARFVRADVYDWLASAEPGSADVVFSSYGALPWLSDLPTWARGVARVLAPGGRLVVLEFHPMACALDGGFRVAYPYFAEAPVRSDEGIGDYVGEARGALSPSGHVETGPFANPEPCYEWPHGVGDVVGALLGAGLVLEQLVEYPYANGCDLLRALVEREGRRFWPPEGVPSIPLMIGYVARRPA